MAPEEQSAADFAHLEELRLGGFKSFKHATLRFSELTLLIGRNGGGKSNALDALSALSQLAMGNDLRDALDGSRADAEAIRGGAEGCAPYDSNSIELGCRVRAGSVLLDFDVEIQVRPVLRVVREKLTCVEGLRHNKQSLAGRDLYVTDPQQPDRSDVVARCFDGKRGGIPPTYFFSNALLLTQLSGRLGVSDAASRLVHSGAAFVRAALAAVFVLDPVPHLMRQYVNVRDSELRRNAENLSAAVAALRETRPDDFARLENILRAMPERKFEQITTARSELGDVLVALLEPGPDGKAMPVSARLMSDGMLRFLAFGTALLSAPLLSEAFTAPMAAGGAIGQRMLVLEEIENGLHPTMAAEVVGLVKDESRRRRIRTLLTSHSPALLNALDGNDHAGVIVVDRDPDTGVSRLTRLVDLPGYPSLMAQGDLGDVVSRGKLAEAGRRRTRVSDSFAELFL